MSDIGKFNELMVILRHLGIEESIKRLCPTGSGAMTCCGGREAGDQQDSAEGRSREDWRVSPGKAEALRRRLSDLANGWWEKCHEAQVGGIPISPHEAFRQTAAAVDECKFEVLEFLDSVAPEPDSEARNERSGRRNSEL